MRYAAQPAFVLHARAWRETSLLLEAFTREEAHEALRQRGATVMGTVGKTTQVLIAGASAGSKYAAAQKLGIPILGEAAFIRHLE